MVLKKIRQNTGLLLGFVVIAMILFLSSDFLFKLLQPKPQGDQVIGEIAGKDIPLNEFQQAFNDVTFGQNVPEAQMKRFRDQAWDQLVFDNAYAQEFEALGIDLTKDETKDMVNGITKLPAFATAPVDQINQFIEAVNNGEPGAVANWEAFKNFRLREKYNNLFSQSVFVSTEQAKQKYATEKSTASFDYLYVPFYMIPDSLVDVSDEKLNAYLKDHQDEFEGSEGRTIKFVRFDVAPTTKDRAEIQKEVNETAEQFKATPNTVSFAASNSDNPSSAFPQPYGSLPADLQQKAKPAELTEGAFFGPYQQGNVYKMYKVAKVETIDSLESVQASHILFKTDGKDADEVRETAEGVLKRVKDGEDFGTLAAEFGEDGTRANGGSLGEFGRGQMVKPFEEACFDAKKEGLLPELVETQFGFHIIKIDRVAGPQTQFTVASIEKQVAPSSQTYKEIRRKARNFATKAKKANGVEGFEAAAKEDSLVITSAENIAPGTEFVSGLGKVRSLVSWAYNDEREIGEVSSVEDLDNYGGYVVAVLSGKQSKDEVSLDGVRGKVEQAVRKEQKGALIQETLAAAEGDLDAKVNAFNEKHGAGKASKRTASNVALSSNNVSGAGNEPAVIGTAFGLDADETSDIIIGDNGVFIIQLKAKEDAQEVADYSNTKESLESQQMGSLATKAKRAIEEGAEIKDFRYKFF